MNSTCVRTVFKMKSWNFTGTSVTLWDRSRKGWRFYFSSIGVINKGLITQNTWIRRAFAQFSRWRVETSQERRRHPETGRGRVVDPTVSPQGSEIKGHSKRVNSTCIYTVFKIKSWNFTGTSETLWGQVVEWLTFLPFPIGVRNKGLIIHKTWIRRAFAQFSRLRVETSQERRRHSGTGRGRVDNSTVPPQGSKIKG